MLIGAADDAGKIVNLRNGPKRKRMNAFRADHYLFDCLALVGGKNDSFASIATLQVPRACRGENRRAHGEHQGGAGKLAHENNAADEAGPIYFDRVDRTGANSWYHQRRQAYRLEIRSAPDFNLLHHDQERPARNRENSHSD
jgi:hypothetical protein